MAEAAPNQSMSLSMKATAYGIQKKFPSVRNITCSELESWRSLKKGEDLIVLDTRPVEEYRVSHIPTAIRIDPEKEHDLDVLGIKPDATVVCYCSVGYRSSRVAQKLFSAHKHSQEGKDSSNSRPLEVYNLEGGVFQWACEGRELENSEGDEVATVHPYSSLWGKLLPYNLRHKI